MLGSSHLLYWSRQWFNAEEGSLAIKPMASVDRVSIAVPMICPLICLLLNSSLRALS